MENLIWLLCFGVILILAWLGSQTDDDRFVPPDVKEQLQIESHTTVRTKYYEPRLKESKDLIEGMIQAKKIHYLYHFTDEENLESIEKQGAILSRAEANRKGIAIPRPGGNSLSLELDSRRDLDKYIHLSYNDNQPMLYIARQDGRIRKPVLFLVDPIVMTWEGTMFADKNATDNQANIGPELSDLKKTNFEVAMSKEWTTETQKKEFQAEVLVRKMIPLEYVLGRREL